MKKSFEHNTHNVRGKYEKAVEEESKEDEEDKE